MKGRMYLKRIIKFLMRVLCYSDVGAARRLPG